ncbi:MAG: signal peptidase II [Candidatus Omnitrophica bacterium]|jgi:signal peptidase II|nr:signal peptidase II [Candidatus Omnitrophota bacterium]MDD3274166.1 signal peptidase II [Candidatus Omnitrophota bacterium]MDD5077516.1 signal peptidase II [Candidatus Omnitrophota bacterium]MDD5724828.1 signal peptidase II [Candidatus Omnitrophota bacterium]
MMIFIIVLSVVVSDQAAKFFASRLLSLNVPVPLIKNFLNLTLVHNRGAAFGFFQNQIILFVLVSFFAIGLILHNLKNKTNSLVFNVSLSLILGGAIGNLIDRLRFGYVIDFLDFKVWPVFNIADSMITIAVAALVWELLFHKNAA